MGRVRRALLSFFALAFAVPALAQDDYPPQPDLIQFEPGSSSLTDESEARLLALAAMKAKWPEYSLVLCMFGDSDSVQYEREDSVLETLREQFWSDLDTNVISQCPAIAKHWTTGDVTSDSALMALLSARAIDSLLYEKVLTRANYVPDTGWEKSFEGASLFYEDWFGDHLHAMGEPSFESLENLRLYESRFRLSVFPSYLSAYAVRIDELETGRYVLYWTILDGAGGNLPGEISASGGKSLSHAEGEEFGKLLRAADLSRKPMSEAAPESKDGKILICLHATEFAFEQVSALGRSFLQRSFCDGDDSALNELSDYVMRLSGEKLKQAIKKAEIERFGDEEK